MKKLLLLVCTILISVTANAQTYFINGAIGNGDFEAASSLATWSYANQSTNSWEISTGAKRAGAKGAYIRNAANTNLYTFGTAQKSFMYSASSYIIPTSANCAYLSFWYMGNGEAGQDFMQAYLTSVVPTAGVNPPAGSTQLGGEYSMVGTTWTQVTVAINPALFGTAQRVMFYWVNNKNGTSLQAPVAIDDVQLYYNTTGPVNDNCAGAVSLPVGGFGSCATTAGDISCASNSGIIAPSGTADDDVWYSFVATGTAHTVNIGSTTINPVIQIFSGTCASLTSIANANASTVNANGLIVGATYYVRVYSFAATKPIPGNFTVCVTSPRACPADLGPGSVAVASLPYSIAGQTTCGMVNDITSANATACGSINYFTGEDAVYSFTPATSGNITVTLTSTGTYTGLMLYEGCPFSGNCINFAQSSTGNKNLSCTPVTAGLTYYLVIDSWSAPACNPYSLTISAPVVTSIANDDACGAINVPVNTTCTFSTYDLTGACSSSNPAPTCGSYNGQDVWLKFIVPTTGTYAIDTKEGTMTDALMAIYRGATCGGALALIACDNDASANGLMPYITSGSFVAGETIYIRIMPNGVATPGTFQLCISNPCIGVLTSNNDPCNAIAIPIGGAAYGDNTCATNGVGTTEPAINAGISTVAGTYNSVWYKFVVPASGAVKIRTTLGSLRNTIMGVYSGICGTGLANENSNDDITLCATGGSNFNSELNLNSLPPGATYHIVVDGKNDLVGDFTVSIIDGLLPWPLVRGSDCGAAKDVCDDTTSVANPGFQAFGNYCDLGSGTCLSTGEKNSAWFNIPIIAGGTLAFDIVPNDYGFPTSPFTGQSNPNYTGVGAETDYDFAIWKVSGTGTTAANITTTCAAIAATTPLAPLGCSYSGLGVTGLNGTVNGTAPAAYTGFGGAYTSQINVLTGDNYLLLVNNFSNSVNGFSLNFKGTTGIAGVNYAAGISGTTVVWTGGNSSTRWDNTDNWGGCAVPSCTKDAVVDALSLQPTITAAMGVVNCKDLLVNVGATLTMAAGATLKVCGNINILGSIICDPTSTIWFNDENIAHTINGKVKGLNALGNLRIEDANNFILPNCRVQILVDMDLKGSFSVINNTSIFDMNQKYMKVAGNFTNIAANTTFNNSNGPAGTLEFNGSTTQSFSPGGNLVLNNVIINQTTASNVNIIGTAVSKMIMSLTGSLVLAQGKITFSTPATQEVYLQNPAAGAVNAGSITSYVEGQFRRGFTTKSIGSYDFPVGNSTKGYERININYTDSTNAGSNFSLAAVFNNWGTTFPFPTPLGVTECTQLFNNPWLDNGNWSVDEYDATILLANKGAISVPGLYNATLYNRSYTNGATSLGWTVAKSPSAAPAWVMDGICQATPITAVRRNDMSDFSRFATIQSATVLLPIELTTFDANAELTYNAIQWITATETNNDYFEIEACDDGINFKAIEKIKGAGNSNATLYYKARDKNYSPTTYYRLKQVDFDGKYSYSEMRVVGRFNKNTKDAFNVDVAPNPTDNQVKVTITSGVKENYTVVVYSVEGKLLMKSQIQEKDFTKGILLDLSALENGLYNVEVYGTKGTVVKKVIKFN